LSRPQPIPHRNASNRPQPVPHQKVATKHPLVSPFVPNLSTDFILLVPDYPSRLELGYPNHCLFGHVLDGSDPLENVDSSKEISNPTYADICNPLKKPRSGVSASNQSATRTNNKKLKQCKRAKVNFSKDTKPVPKSRSGISKSRSDI